MSKSKNNIINKIDKQRSNVRSYLISKNENIVFNIYNAFFSGDSFDDFFFCLNI